MSKILVDTIDTRSGTTTLTLGSTNAGTIALGSGDVQSNFLNPYFHVRLTSNQDVTDDAQTKVAFNDVTLDSDSCWDATNYRFTPSKAGRYYFFAQVTCQAGGANNALTEAMASFRKNGTRIVTGSFTTNTSTYASLFSAQVAIMLALTTSDYIEVYGRSNISTGTAQFTPSHQNATYFMGYRIGS